MNIPENILQAVADTAFQYIKAYGALKTGAENPGYEWECQADCRSAVIQHALDNPALAPFLAGGGEYTDEEITTAWVSTTVIFGPTARSYEDRLRAFLAALPRRDKSPAIAEAIARAEPIPPAEPEPAAQVPLGPEDMKPNAWFKMQDGSIKELDFVLQYGVAIKGQREVFFFRYLKDSGIKMNESIPDTGRWDKDAWRPCSKPGKEVAK